MLNILVPKQSMGIPLGDLPDGETFIMGNQGGVLVVVNRTLINNHLRPLGGGASYVFNLIDGSLSAELNSTTVFPVDLESSVVRK